MPGNFKGYLPNIHFLLQGTVVHTEFRYRFYDRRNRTSITIITINNSTPAKKT